MLYLEFPLQKASINLALEEALFDNLPPDHPGYFILWQNLPAVIIGRNQILQEVINLNFISQNGIPVIRRNTGGGAVYHDSGNLNYSFIANRKMVGKNPFTYFLEKIVSALKEIGIMANISGRNDLETLGKKFSGNSQLSNSTTLLHHGTLLINTDLEQMQNLLQVDESKYKSRGISSLRARVMNLSEVTNADMDDFKSSLKNICSSKDGILSQKIWSQALDLVQSKYENPEWTYGKSPTTTLEKRKRFAWGEFIVKLSMQGGKIRECAFLGDFIHLKALNEVEESFKDHLFIPEEMIRLCATILWENYIHNCSGEELRNFLCKELFA